MEPIENKPRDVDDEALDALLAQAKWPKSGEGATRRLVSVWAAVSPARERNPRRIPAPMFIAAAVGVIAAMLAVILILRREQPREFALPALMPPAPHDDSQPLLAVDPSTTPRIASVSVTSLLYEPGWREPTVRERLVMYAELRESKSRASSRQNTGSTADVTALLKKLSDPRLDARFAAARTLGRTGDPGTIELLIRQVNQNVSRRESLAALMWSRDESATRFVDAMRGSSDLAAVVRSVEIQVKSSY